MPVYKFYLKNGQTFEGTREELYQRGYIDDDVQDSFFQYEHEINECLYSSDYMFYNSFRHVV